MDRRQFLRNAAILATGIVAVDQLHLLELLSWEPKRLWTGYTPVNTIASLNELFKKTNKNILAALQMQTPEATWMRKMTRPEPLIVSSLQMRVPLQRIYG